MGHKAEILGLEPRRSDSKSEMLPITSYLIIIIQLYADAAGIEPTTPGFGDQRSNRAELRIQASAQHTRVQGGRYLFTIMGDRQKVSPTLPNFRGYRNVLGS